VVIASNGFEGTYGIDDKIESSPATVKQVFFDRVIIQNGNKRETLMLDGVEYDNQNVASLIKNPDVLR
jgi:general secretion pathway protein C